MRGLAGKVIVVAGGATGIGRGCALRLSEEGARVVVGDLDGSGAEKVAAQIVEAGGTAIGVPFDIAVEDRVDELFRTAVDTYGGVDGVHVNAADTSAETVGVDTMTDIESVPLEVFDRTIAVDLRGHVLVTRRALPELRARGGGALVYTSSDAAFLGEPMRSAYGIAKAGMLAIVRHVASRFGAEGIRANAIAPGFVATEKMDLDDVDSDMMQAARESTTRTTRLGRPGDIAGTVAFLCSDEGEWINGQSWSIDGGLVMR
jgi:NAD(P)-dependent dehydrogenase (short-subunit alcohol dehydrogenase family)